jgi:hypothetical protein
MPALPPRTEEEQRKAIAEEEQIQRLIKAHERNEAFNKATPHPILDEARAIITGPRADAYGNAREDFKRQAIMWSQILDVDVSPAQVAMCMIATKLCRETNSPAHDNRLDIIGYTALLEEICDD